MPQTRLTVLLAFAAVIAVAPAAGADPAALVAQTRAPWPFRDSAGRVHALLVTGPRTDPVTNRPSSATKRFFASHYWRGLGYAGYWDRRNEWHPGWLYKDAYAIYRWSVGRQARFILHDAAGRRLYIDWDCARGTCPQYAADIGDPRFRAAWIAEARARLRAGYRGLYVDDVNLDMSVSDGRRAVQPINPRTVAPYSDEEWRHDMARFMVAVRAAFPRAEVVHNTPWFAGAEVAGTEDPDVAATVASADFVSDERGLTDEGLTDGTGEWALDA